MLSGGRARRRRDWPLIGVWLAVVALGLVACAAFVYVVWVLAS